MNWTFSLIKIFIVGHSKERRNEYNLPKYIDELQRLKMTLILLLQLH